MKTCRIVYGHDRYSGSGYYIEVPGELWFWVRLGDGWFPGVYPSAESARNQAAAWGYSEQQVSPKSSSETAAVIWCVVLVVGIVVAVAAL